MTREGVASLGKDNVTIIFNILNILHYENVQVVRREHGEHPNWKMQWYSPKAYLAVLSILL